MGRAQRNPSPANPSPPLTHLDGGLCNPTPILRQPSLGHIPMQCRIRPIHGPRDVSMFHRIEVDVIDVALQVVFVADQMLPRSAESRGGKGCVSTCRSRGSSDPLKKKNKHNNIL